MYGSSMMNRELDKKLKNWFVARSSGLNEQRDDLGQYRYIPRATISPSWCVYDRAAQRFLTDDETLALRDNSLWEERIA
jgi:hypothetical protein